MKRVAGVVIGTVVDVNDPMGEGRVMLNFPWMTDSPVSAWAPVAAALAGPSRGMFYQPEVGDEALVGFEQGDFAHPFVLGYLWNGVDKPPETDMQNRVILTPGGHTLRFEDGNAKVILRSAKGHEILLDDSASGNMIQLKTSGQLTVVMDDKDASIQMQGGGRILALRGGQVQIS